MDIRVKVFTAVTGHGETLTDSPLETHINQWLAQNRINIVEVTQSESERPSSGHHVTVCLWYTPDEE